VRITPGMIGAQLTLNLQRGLAAIARQQDHLSSGRRVLAPSDDPGGTAQALTLRARQAASEQFRRNLAAARARLQSGDAAVQGVLELVTRAREIAVQGASDTSDAAARRALADQANQLLEAMVGQANARDGSGVFLFGGQESTVPPYGVVRDASGQITALTPNPRGIDGTMLAEVGEDLTVQTGVGGTAVFGAATDATYAFAVLVRLRDALAANAAAGLQTLTLEPDVDASGAANPNRYRGVDAPTDLTITGPAGTASVGLTSAADDPWSAVGGATSAIATAAAVNAVAGATGVTATATTARLTVDAGFTADVVLDGTPGQTLVVNGVSITATLGGGSPTARRDALVGALNAVSGTTGVLASAAGADDFVLEATDGRNISIRTDGVTGAGTVNDEVFGFTTGLTAEAVVARGGLQLTAVDGALTTVAAPGADFADQVGGEGTASGVRAELDALTVVLDRATLAATTIGVRLGWLDLLDERLATEGVGLAASLSRLEDLDVPRAVAELQRAQSAYEAALASGASLVQLSLLDFLD
jgi:flagellar hook-associated protein 3 FlgL